MTNRARLAGETRRRIVIAATRLFLRDGYARTSISAVAKAAGVSEPTVYAAFRSKAGVLRSVVTSQLRGGDDAVPVAETPEWRTMEAEADPRRQLRRFARLHRVICDREAGLFAQLEAAAGSDPEATELLREYDQLRYRTQSRLAHVLRRHGSLRDGLGVRSAADVIWTLASERTYLALTRDRGWSPQRYQRWLAEQLVAALL